MSSDDRHVVRPWQHLYNSAVWKRGRERWLARHPLCAMCEQRGIIRPATVVDHKVPHKGDPVLFFDEGNWQSLCKPDHDSAKQRQERNGHAPGCDVHGNPLDATHAWSQS